MPDLILDACVLSNFAHSDSLGVLKELYDGHIYLTDFVYAEILRGIQKGHSPLLEVKSGLREGCFKKVALRTKGENEDFERLSESLGLGEASSIAIAKHRRFVFASDDLAARREAGRFGVALTGTLGILLRAVSRTIIETKDADRILKKMIEHGFFSPVRSVTEIR
jgi:predicted nucleic acid-binding protein